ncbi:metal cation symporter ZIP8-like [Adelges cooleyi]|uniref:metal cation symporter ZIP8-like n=1 Tax=Adelges cooleyi TaxID=133065 RepID=UPI0021809154|nr:metal cation symporter ZIP8-like [Adelges cooleyi]XP_050422232.1 metal cation symporter ZIP8-like [Adelges cooleyi]XP_050422233.1 metal cation symporter ZIP8-like [Adelges cooleyi]
MEFNSGLVGKVVGFAALVACTRAVAEPPENCWRKLSTTTPSCDQLGSGNDKLCIVKYKCNNSTLPNSCSTEFISYDDTVPLREESFSTDPDYTQQKLRRSTSAEAWIGGFTAVSVISLSGLIGALFWPLLNDPRKKNSVMRVLLGLATGSLSSTAIFQLIPEAFKISDSLPHFRSTVVIMWISVWGLYTLEILASIIFHKKEKPITDDELGTHLPITNGGTVTEMKLTAHNHNSHSSHGHSHKLGKSIDDKLPISPLALLVLFGDSLHNIIDGMSIGAAFSENVATGISISIAIACEEFPHEIGDFAILIQSGLSFRRALCFNFLSACTSFVGMFFGICLGNMEYSGFVFAFAGGLFLFITLSHLTPEMKSMIEEDLVEGKKSAYIGLLLQNIGMLTGAGILYLITFTNAVSQS